jgi:hypothetical protein
MQGGRDTLGVLACVECKCIFGRRHGAVQMCSACFCLSVDVEKVATEDTEGFIMAQ